MHTSALSYFCLTFFPLLIIGLLVNNQPDKPTGGSETRQADCVQTYASKAFVRSSDVIGIAVDEELAKMESLGFDVVAVQVSACTGGYDVKVDGARSGKPRKSDGNGGNCGMYHTRESKRPLGADQEAVGFRLP